MKILLVEDNPTIIKGLEYSFSQYNATVFATTTVRKTKEFLKENTIDIVILDVTLPDGNGFDLFQEEIKPKEIPTIFLTAKEDEDDIVRGLNLGADDYVNKPFSTKELFARINRLLMRKEKRSIIRIKDICFDMDKMVLYKETKEVPLTSLELKILYLLFLNLGQVVTRNTILDKIWESTGNDVDDHTVTVYLKRIREKIGSPIITTIKGIGYRIDQDEE